MRGEKQWVVKLNSKNKIVALYPSIRMAAQENCYSPAEIQQYIKKGKADEYGTIFCLANTEVVVR